MKMLTFIPLEQINEYEKCEGSELNGVKEILAHHLTEMVHGKEEADKALAAARSVFTGGAAADMPTTELTETDFTDGSITVIDMLVKSGLAPSKGEARRLIQQGGVMLGEDKVTDVYKSVTLDEVKAGVIIKKGKKVFQKFTV